MATRVHVERVERRVGTGARQRVAYCHKGTLCLFRTDVLNHDDYVCAPLIDTFTLEQVRTIGLQVEQGYVGGVLPGGLRWEVRE